MNKAFYIAKKELSSFFKSPMAYIILATMISIFNIFFFIIIDQNQEASLENVFLVMDFMLIFLMPIITMRLFSEEKSNGTMEFLMTAPVSNTAIVLGKYLSVLFLFSIMISITFVYFGIVEFFANPDRLTILFGYIGVYLDGALFLAIGLMTSSWTRHQTVSGMMSLSIIFLLYFLGSIAPFFSEPLESLIQSASSLTHLENFVDGNVTVNDLSYYLSGILVCLIMTRISIENRRLTEVFSK